MSQDFGSPIKKQVKTKHIASIATPFLHEAKEMDLLHLVIDHSIVIGRV